MMQVYLDFWTGILVVDANHKVIENTTDHLKRMHNYRKSSFLEMKYSEIYKEWKDDPIVFWKKNAEDVSWIKFPEKILTKNDFFYEWFSDGILNTSYNADKNILEGRRSGCYLL